MPFKRLTKQQKESFVSFQRADPLAEIKLIVSGEAALQDPCPSDRRCKARVKMYLRLLECEDDNEAKEQAQEPLGCDPCEKKVADAEYEEECSQMNLAKDAPLPAPQVPSPLTETSPKRSVHAKAAELTELEKASVHKAPRKTKSRRRTTGATVGICVKCGGNLW